MPKLPWFKFSPSDWINDPCLSICTPATRGVWMDLICAMHQSGRSGELRGTTEQIARLARSSTAELTQALTELQTTGTADVTFRNKDVTVINRKMKREAKDRVGTALRVMKHRSNGECNGSVTPESKEVREEKGEQDRARASAPPAPRPPSWKKLDENGFYSAIALYAKEFPKDMLRKFFEYWKEPSATGIMRFQLEKTWDTHRRLKSWQERDNNFGKPRTAASDISGAPPLKTMT